MKQIIQTKNLSELLDSLQREEVPVLVKLNTRKGADYLMDSMIKRLVKGAQYEVLAKTMDQAGSKRINQELHLQSNPSLLLIYKGEIISILSGITSRHQIVEALAQVPSAENKRQTT